MPDPTALLDAAATVPDATIRTLAASTGLPKSSVHAALARFAPVKEMLGQIKRDELTAAWQQVAIKAIARMDALLDGDPEAVATVPQKGSIGGEVRNYAVGGGIASEKALLFAGQPTAITATTHAHRLALPEQAAELASLASRLVRLAGLGPEGTAHDPVIATARDVTPSDGG